jgi:hypothetical protein
MLATTATVSPYTFIYRSKGAVAFHFKVPICDLWENGKMYDIDSCRDYICGLISKILIMMQKKSSF